MKFAPDAAISVYAEVERRPHGGLRARPRARASTSAAVPADRRGLRESVLGRMERHGGRAAIHTAPGAGTEVELVMQP